MSNQFTKLASIDVGEHIEKKAGLSYLSWAWAVDQLMRLDAFAQWDFHEPKLFGETMMVSCTVTAFGKPITMHLPVMDHRNNAIKNPDAVQVNKAMMRCLVKGIACHGLGLYIYAGEDLPSIEVSDETLSVDQVSHIIDLAKEVNQDIGLMLKAFKVDSIDKILADRYEYIIKNLESKKK